MTDRQIDRKIDIQIDSKESPAFKSPSSVSPGILNKKHGKGEKIKIKK